VVQQALRTASFIGGPMVENFEKAFARFCETEHSVAVNSGTDALRFALMATGIGAGDTVVTVPHTFIATTEAISQAGARPEFVDIDERTYNMDPEKLREYLEENCTKDTSGKLISRRTGNCVAAIIPVHLYGQMADMDPILALAERHNLVVIEDACQAHGAQYFSKQQNRWRTAGSMGAAAAFSFYPGKNLGACGEAGAVTTNSQELARKIQMLRDHGQAKKYYHEIEGFNGRLDAIQAGMLSVKLAHLSTWTEARRDCARRYQELFTAALGTQFAASCSLPAASCISIPYEPSWSKAVYHLYVIRVRNRAQLQAHLAEAKIGTGIHYPIPLHLQNAYRGLGYQKGDFPVTETVADEIVSLPMFPGLSAVQQRRVVDNVMKCYASATNPVPG
jgi:dTDP-4-amino-4,6-dideoxygalactose transaminase